ncbi:hypothetical protein GN277_17965 [Lachnospiraceae bacterium WCA-9-b2]|uniref:Uncharacterized protein n=1 Tax=Sporofaciens musculi TaxID=2681861 RepID=A0A7X3MJ37_9FIRM|nr:hypothetical protein [Sporofaciens musculi]MXP77192.1 hypothetical protein [Sporofaciens musculi]
MRKTYNVSFFKNNTYQSHIVKSDKSPARIARYYRDVKRVNNVLGISLATSESIKHGKTIITI